MRHSGNSWLLAMMLYGLAEKAYKSSTEYKGSHLTDLKPLTNTCIDLGNQGLSRLGWIEDNNKSIITDRFEYYN